MERRSTSRNMVLTCAAKLGVSPSAGSATGTSAAGAGLTAETRLPGGPAAVRQPQLGIGMCSGGLDSAWEFSTASREPHSM